MIPRRILCYSVEGVRVNGNESRCSTPGKEERQRYNDKEKEMTRGRGNGGQEKEGAEGKREEAFQDAITIFLGRASNQQLFL